MQMLFNSQIFVFLFLPVVWLLYFGMHRFNKPEIAKFVLFLSSIWFYGYFNYSYLILLIGSICFNYGIHLLIRHFKDGKSQNAGISKAIMVVGVLANIAVIFYFKYFNFFLGTVNQVFHTDIVLKDILLPLGISFFTFQQISFVVDSYSEDEMKYSFLDYCVFVSFFPQLVAGPIVLHQELIPQFSQKDRFRPKWENLSVGVRYFVIGLFKKTMIADRFGNIVSMGYVFPFTRDIPGTFMITVAYTIQIYFDFSGYSDMAIGLGKMFGFDIPMNFDQPYKAKNISEFWKRWHMTLTGFLTKYLYIPLGGNRKGIKRTCINTMLVFLISGLWHGAAWAFVFWGGIHGMALVFHRLLKQYIEKVPSLITGLCTFLFVNIAWIFFRTESLRNSYYVIKRFFVGGFSGNNLDLCHAFLGDGLELAFGNISYASDVFGVIAVLFTVVGFLVAFLLLYCAPSSHQLANRKNVLPCEGVVFAIMAVLSVLTFTNVSTFLYFNF